MDISIVIPLYNEAESLPELHSWIKTVMDQHKLTYEVIFVDDGSKDNPSGRGGRRPTASAYRARSEPDRASCPDHPDHARSGIQLHSSGASGPPAP